MKLYNILLAAAAAIMLTACSNDEDPAPANERVVINVTSGMVSRAHDNMWDANDQIGVFEFKDNTLTDAKNRSYTTVTGNVTSATFTSTNPIYLPTDDSTRDYIAYYPYTNSLNNNTYSVDVSTQTSQEAIDLMLSNKVTNINRANNNVNFVFTHKLVKLVLTISAGADMQDTDLNGMTTKLTNQYAQGTLDVTGHNNVVQVTGSPQSDITLNTAADGKSAEGIVLPATALSNVKLTFTMSNTASFTVPFVWALSDAGLSSFEAEKKYTFNLTISKTAVTLSGCTITNWNDGGSYSGTAEM